MVRASLLMAGLALAIAAGLAGCSHAPPSMAACLNDKATDQQRIAACSGAVREGATGETLATAYRRRGEAESNTGDATHAAPDFDQAIRLAPQDDAAYTDRAGARQQLGDAAGARADDQQVVRIRPGADAYVSLSIADYAVDDFDAAITDAAKAIEINPDWAPAWSAQGYGYLGKGEYEVALADFASALRITPHFINAVDGRAEAFRRKGDYEAAIAVCADAVQADPSDIRALACRADAYDAKGDYADAVADYTTAIGGSPNQAWLYLGRSAVHLDAGETALAITDADQGLSMEPQDPTALNNACWTRAAMGVELPAALADCQAALDRRPRDAATLDSRAMVWFRMGRLTDALAGYNAALAADPTLTPSRFMRGIIKRRLGDDAGGQADIAAAEKLDPTVARRYAGFGIKP